MGSSIIDFECSFFFISSLISFSNSIPPFSIEFVDNRYDAVDGCDGLILITEWKEFRNPNLELLSEMLNEKVIFDGRNIYDKKITRKGFELFQIGC